MKTRTKKTGFREALILGGLFALTMPIMAGGNIQMNLTDNGSRAAVSYSSLHPTSLKISIENQEGTMVFYNEQKNDVDSYKKLYDFSQLHDGNYNLIAIVDGEKQVKKFSIDNAKISIKDETIENENLIVPYFNKDGAHLICLYQNPLSEHVKVCFLSKGESFFEDSSESGKAYSKKFDLSLLPSGNYDILLHSGDSYFSYKLIID
jgi:hypothetical protein